MTFTKNWKRVLLHAWSVRFIVLAAILTGIEVALGMLTPDITGIPPRLFAALGALSSSAALVARIMAQDDMEDEDEQDPTPET